MSVSEENANIRDHHRRLLAAKYELRWNLYKALCKDPSLPSDLREENRFKLSKLRRNSSFTRVGTAASSPAAHAPSTRPSVCPVSFSVLLPPKACSMALRKRLGSLPKRCVFKLFVSIVFSFFFFFFSRNCSAFRNGFCHEIEIVRIP